VNERDTYKTKYKWSAVHVQRANDKKCLVSIPFMILPTIKLAFMVRAYEEKLIMWSTRSDKEQMTHEENLIIFSLLF
jgi:hypothetical protein